MPPTPYLIASPDDDRDYTYVPLDVLLPPAIDMRRYGGAVEQQGIIQSCTANAGVSAFEMILQRGNCFTDLSRSFLYAKTRELAGEVGDVGATLRNTLRAAAKFGVPPESVCPYDPTFADITPNDFVYPIAATRKLARYERINLVGEEQQSVLRAMNSAIAEGCPVLAAFHIGSEFFDITGPMAQQRYRNVGGGNPLVGGHAVALVGYRDGYYIAENSLGPEFGEGGYFAFTSNLLMDTMELWVVKSFAGLNSQRRRDFLLNQAVCRQFVTDHAQQPQVIIDTAIAFELTPEDIEWLMGWPAGAIVAYANSDIGRGYNWQGFL